jgi:hypothetical protein
MAAGNPFPATSPKHQQQAAFACRKHLKEVAAHLLRGLVDAFDRESRNRFDLFGQNDLLDLARCSNLAFEQRLLAAGPRGALHNDDGQRDVAIKAVTIPAL